jgi:hypothetical protein
MPRKGKRAGADKPKLGKRERRALARRLQEALVERPLDFPAMEAVLGRDQEVVVAALRELADRKPDRLRLRSGILEGRACWWWDAEAGAATEG